MRVLFASSQPYPPQIAGGTESSTHELCLGLLSRGHLPGVACGVLARDFRTVVGLKRTVRRALGTADCMADHHCGYHVFRCDDVVDRLARVVADFEPQVAIAQSSDAAAIASGLTDLGIPTLIYLRDPCFVIGKLKNRHLVRYVANSQFTARLYNRMLGVRADVLPPIVDPARYRTEPCGEYVTFINPVKEKGVDVAVSLASAMPNVPFQFVESWALRRRQRQALRRQLASLRNVRFRNRCHDMREVYRTTRVLLVPSQWDECWGRVVTESQVSGIPSLASDSGALPESVGAGGFVVKRDACIDEWIKRLQAIWQDRSVYSCLSKSALEHAGRTDIDPTHLRDRFAELLQEHAQSKRRVA